MITRKREVDWCRAVQQQTAVQLLYRSTMFVYTTFAVAANIGERVCFDFYPVIYNSHHSLSKIILLQRSWERKCHCCRVILLLHFPMSQRESLEIYIKHNTRPIIRKRIRFLSSFVSYSTMYIILGWILFQYNVGINPNVPRRVLKIVFSGWFRSVHR